MRIFRDDVSAAMQDIKPKPAPESFFWEAFFVKQFSIFWKGICLNQEMEKKHESS